MKDEFGCEFQDAVFLVCKPENEKTDIQQHFETEKKRWLQEYPLKYPKYELIFDRFIKTPEPFKSGDEIALGFALFRAYKIEQQKTMVLEKS